MKDVKIKEIAIWLLFVLFYMRSEGLGVNAWSYPSHNCYDCLQNEEMYYCRHNTSGLPWGQCCKKGSSSSFECNEMYDPEGGLDTKCSSMSPKSPEMRFYYC